MSTGQGTELGALGAACAGKAVLLDFEQRREIALDLADVPASLLTDQFVWLEFSTEPSEAARRLLENLGVLDADAIDAALAAEAPNSYARYEQHLHLVLSTFSNPADLEVERVDVFLGERFLITLYRKRVALLVTLRKEYYADFVLFAKTPSFLLYEIWDQLLQNYLSVQKGLEERVERLQERLKAECVDARVFAQISDLGADLSRLRRVALPARTVLADLVARRSLFVSETTQRSLANLLGTIEHILGDLVTDRELLSEAVNLYMSSVSHRTNDIMKRLTVVSIVFLPLTFIVGVYGMNFEHLPELKWEHGYLYFWCLVVLVVLGLLSILRRARFW